MTDVRTLGRTAWRLYETDGLPSSGPHQPLKSEILSFVDEVDLRAGGTGGLAAQAAADASHGKFFVVSGTVTVAVPSQQATIQAALDAVRQWVIPDGAEVQIQLADGTYNLTAGINIENPYGSRLLVVGNTGTPSSVVIRTAQPSGSLHFGALFYVGAGSGCAFDGMQVEHTTPADGDNTAGFLADRGGYIELRGNIIVDQFDWNLFARRGGVISGFSGGVSKRALDGNAVTYQGGAINLTGWDLLDAEDPDSYLGAGAVNEGGTMDLQSCTLTGNKYAGLHNVDGYTRAGGCDFSDNLADGIVHDSGLLLFDPACTAGGNAGYGYRRTAGGRPFVTDITTLTEGAAGANTSGLFQPFMGDLCDTQPGDMPVSPNTNESRRYDTKGSGQHYWNVGGANKMLLSSSQWALGTSSPLAGVVAHIALDLSGAANVGGVRVSGDIKSDATASYRGYVSRPTVQDAAFTLPELTHFHANPGSKGAAATVTDQYGFKADGALTAAGSNYGFWSGISAASGRWAFYDAGGAASHFAGAVSSSSTLKAGAFTVATLPAAATAGNGARASVTDANDTTFMSVVAGGGSNIVPVVCDGTNWKIG